MPKNLRFFGDGGKPHGYWLKRVYRKLTKLGEVRLLSNNYQAGDSISIVFTLDAKISFVLACAP